MRSILDLVGVAVSGLTSRLIRTLLIMLGPIIGVAAIVAAVGLTQSAKGDLQASLAELGTNLIVAEASGSFGETNPTFPSDAADRAEALSVVAQASAVTDVTGVITIPYDAARDEFAPFPIPVVAADIAMPEVLEVEMRSGRWLSDFDEANAARSVVLGSELADRFGYRRAEQRTVQLGGIDYGVVGVIDKAKLIISYDTAVFITPSAAIADFDANEDPNKLYVRAVEGQTERAADALPVAINLGGSDELTYEFPSDALAAAAETDTTLQAIVTLMGALALIVGGVGIANVLSISVIQRSSEIGIRRALGHSRGRIGMQFLLEAIAVGVAGGIAGAGLGTLVVLFVSRVKDWVAVIDPLLLVGGTASAVVVSVVAGLVPSFLAARLEPLETLRLG